MTWKFRQIKPMKARGTLKDHIWDSWEWVAETKYDGDRRVAQFFDGAYVRFTGTHESMNGTGFVEKTANLPHLRACQSKLSGTVLDGEIVIPPGTEIRGGASKYVTSIMGSSPKEALRKQKAGGYLCYVVFDCLWHKGRDIRGEQFKVRRNFAEQAVREWGNSYVSLASQAVGVGKREFYDRIVGRGGEGVVLKRVDSRYGEEALWVKVKAEATADVVMVGMEMGKGKYEGTCGAIIFAQLVNGKLKRFGTCSGFDDAERALIYKRNVQCKGRVLEIKHNGREPTGAFRHPRFSRWRPDKSPKDCVYREDET